MCGVSFTNSVFIKISYLFFLCLLSVGQNIKQTQPINYWKQYSNFIVQNYALQGTRNTKLCSEHYKTIKVLDELRKSSKYLFHWSLSLIFTKKKKLKNWHILLLLTAWRFTWLTWQDHTTSTSFYLFFFSRTNEYTKYIKVQPKKNIYDDQ